MPASESEIAAALSRYRLSAEIGNENVYENPWERVVDAGVLADAYAAGADRRLVTPGPTADGDLCDRRLLTLALKQRDEARADLAVLAPAARTFLDRCLPDDPYPAARAALKRIAQPGDENGPG